MPASANFATSNREFVPRDVGQRRAFIFCSPPLANPRPNFIDELIFLQPVSSPFRIELHLRFALFLWAGNRNKICAEAALLENFICDSLFGELEVLLGFFKGRIQDRIFDYDQSFRGVATCGCRPRC